MKKENSEIGKNLAEAFVAVVGLVVTCIIAGEAPEQEKCSVFACAWLVATVLSTLFGIEKRRGMFGFVLGVLLSWIGVLVIACFTTRDGAGRDE